MCTYGLYISLHLFVHTEVSPDLGHLSESLTMYKVNGGEILNTGAFLLDLVWFFQMQPQVAQNSLKFSVDKNDPEF